MIYQYHFIFNIIYKFTADDERYNRASEARWGAVEEADNKSPYESSYGGLMRIFG